MKATYMDLNKETLSECINALEAVRTALCDKCKEVPGSFWNLRPSLVAIGEEIDRLKKARVEAM